MVAKDIEKAMTNYYQNAQYVVPNVYFFDDAGETDLLVVNQNNFIFDIEIKVSKSDYKADFNKTKRHEILEFGYYIGTHTEFRNWGKGGGERYEINEQIPTERPNRFYYACPENLIKIEELPKYAGLFYVSEDGRVKKIKEGRLLHKEKINFAEKLCRKFYFKWLNCKNN